MHTKPIPYGGGAAMFLGFLVAVLVAATVPPLRPHLPGLARDALGVVLAAGAIFVVGLIDDVRDMSAPAKMAGQVLAASILYFMRRDHVRVQDPARRVRRADPGHHPAASPRSWVIALTNAVNLIDGLDGLAAGVVAIAAGALAIYGIRLMGLGLLPTRQHRPAGGRDRLRDLPRLPAPQLQPGPDLHGRRRRALPRACSWRPPPW